MSSRTLVVALLVAIAARAHAQAPAPVCVIDGAPRPPRECGLAEAANQDPLARYLYPLELVMAHQQEIGLTDRQRSAIQAAVKEAQSKFVDAQFSMSAEVEKLQRLLQPAAPDEAKVVEQVDRVLTLEREIKRAQVALMVRIKSQLTEQQQVALQRLRRQVPSDQLIQLNTKPPAP